MLSIVSFIQNYVRKISMINIMKYLKEFIVGSSFPVVASFYYGAYHRDKNFEYFPYTLAAPLWFGIWNILSLFIAEKYKLSLRMRFLVVSILSVISIAILQQTILFPYNYTKEEWKEYYVYIVIKYMITWNLIIYYINKYI
tara:strand:- start:179 stop:601 length:423 start_codon:yes stop_codon:yes gene_type:complete